MSGHLDTQNSLWAVQSEIARRGALPLVGYIVVLTAIYSATDILFFEDNGVNLLASVVGWVLGYLLLVQLMRVSAFEGERMPGGVGTYFGLGLVIGFAVVIGLIFLLLPGLYLLMRWTPAYARAYASGDNLGEAMRWSWDKTAAIQGPLILAILPALAPIALLLLVGFAAGAVTDDIAMIDGPFTIISMNFMVCISVAWLQLLGVAAYRLIEREPEELIETFS